MRLKKMKVKGFRSFNEEETIEFDEFTAFIGPNGSGKTTTFQALLKLFGQTAREREIKYSDFHIPRDVEPKTINENSFHIEAVIEFNEIEDAESTIKNYTIPEFINNFVIEEAESVPYIRMILIAEWKRSNQPEGIIEYSIKYITSAEEPSEDNMISVSRSHLSQIHVMYIPAVRNPEEQLKTNAGTILWRMMNAINFSAGFKAEIDLKIGEVNNTIDQHEGISKLKEILGNEWSKYHDDTRYKNIDLKYNNNDIEKILKVIEPHFSPNETGKSNTVDALGDGMRSLFYISLVSTLLETEMFTLKDMIDNPDVDKNSRLFSNQPPLLTLLIVEEPENHIATHLLGRVMYNLRKISGYSNSQVLLSSHTPAIIKRVDATEIRHFRNCSSKSCTIVNSLYLPNETDKAYKYIKNAVQAYPELYFSAFVILGEGDSEEIILPKLLKTKNIELDKYEISVVPLGGRHVNHMWKLLNQLKIPHITLLDLDTERGGGGWGRIKYCIDQLIENGITKDCIFKDPKIDYSDWIGCEITTNKEMDDLMVWVVFLESFNIFFSNPLDIDFLMIKHFKSNYQKIMESNEGPKIKFEKEIDGEKKKEFVKILKLNDKELKSKEYVERLKLDIGKTLKDSDKDGKVFSDVEKELMIWYAYFFLGRGKPSTHLLAFNNITDDELMANMPPVFERLIERVAQIVEA